MTRPASQEKLYASVHRAIKQLENSATSIRKWHNTVDPLKRQEKTIYIDIPYVLDPETNRWGADFQQAAELIRWPSKIAQTVESNPKDLPMGFFQDIEHAWVALESTSLVLWDYKKTEGLISCPVVSSPIIDAALVSPLSGTLFSNQVQYLLVILTECDVRLFALVEDKSSTSRWKVCDTSMTAPLSECQLSTSLLATPSKRILLGGVDGALYEYVYDPNLPKHSGAKKHRQIQRASSHFWSSFLPGVVRDFISSTPTTPITSLVLDKTHQIIYALHDLNNTVSIYSAHPDIKFLVACNLTELAKGLGTLNQVVSLSIISSTSKVSQVVALTNSGQRLLLKAAMNTSANVVGLEAFSLRGFPTGITQSTSQCVLAHGLLNIIIQSNSQLIAIQADSSDKSNRCLETVTSLPLLGSVQALIAVPQRTIASSEVTSKKRTADGQSKPHELDFLRDLGSFGEQFTRPRQVFLTLSNVGIQQWIQRAPMDHVDAQLRKSHSLMDLFDWYGPSVVGTMLFALPQNPHAFHALFELEGTDQINGLKAYIAYLLEPIWMLPLKNQSDVILTSLHEKFRALKLQLEQAVPYSVALHTDISPLVDQHGMIREMHTIIGRCADALFGWKQLIQYWKKDWPTTPPLFCNVVGSEEGAKLLQAMVLEIVKENPSKIGPLLLHSSSYFTVWEAAQVQGLQTIAQAKAAATLANRDKLLQESLAQLRFASIHWPPTKPCIQVLRHVVKEYAACSFFHGMVDLTIGVSALFPLAEKSSCYEPLMTYSKSSDALGPVVRLVLESQDELLQHAIMTWLPDISALQNAAWTPFVKGFLREHHPEWYVRLCIQHEDFEDAAEFLWAQAQDTSNHLPISERTTLVGRALSCVEKTSNKQHIQDVHDAFDVFQMQTRILESLRTQSIASTVLETLEFSIMNMSTLFNDYAMVYGLDTECLRILHACRRNEPCLIIKLWKKLLFGFLPNATNTVANAWLYQQRNEIGLVSDNRNDDTFENGTWITPLKTYVFQMGTSLLHSGADYIFPLEEIILILETIHFYYYQATSNEEEWVVKIFIQLKYSNPLLLGIYMDLKEKNESSGVVGLHWLRGMYVIIATCQDRHPYKSLIQQHIKTLETHPEACDQYVRWKELLKGL